MASDSQGRPPIDGTLNVSPWDSLLLEVRRAAYRVGWIDYEIERLTDQERDLLEEIRTNEYPDPIDKVTAKTDLAATRAEIKEWVKESRAERGHLVSVSDKAIRAGLNQRIVSQVQMEQQTITRVLYAGIAAAGLTSEQRELALEAMKREIGQISLERRGDGADGRALLAIGGTDTGPVGLRTSFGMTGLQVSAAPVDGTNSDTRFAD